MAETFLAPQPFNVAIEPEADVTPPGRMPVIAPSLPVVAQEISPERNLYPRLHYGVMQRGTVRFE